MYRGGYLPKASAKIPRTWSALAICFKYIGQADSKAMPNYEWWLHETGTGTLERHPRRDRLAVGRGRGG